MLKSLRNFIFILAIYFAAIWLANQFSPFKQKPMSFTNTIGISFTLVSVDDKEFHKLYKRSSIKFSDIEWKKKNNQILPIYRPYKFYLSNEELNPNSFSEFIAETDYTFDYYFNQLNHPDIAEEPLTISKQDAQSLASWLSHKEQVGYQILENREVDLACKDFSKNNSKFDLLQVNSNKFENICSETSIDTIKQYAQVNGYRLLRDLD